MQDRFAGLALLVCASAALAGDVSAPAKSALHAPDPWKEQETTTETATWHESEVVGSGNPVSRGLEYIVVRKCLEVDTDGRWLKGTLYFRRWIRTQGVKVDRSLEGGRIAIVPGARWDIGIRVAKPNAAISEEGARWLENFVKGPGALGDEEAEAVSDDLPAGELSVGTPVEGRLPVTERQLATAGFPSLAAGIVGKFTLTAVEPLSRSARITFEREVDYSFEGTAAASGKDSTLLPGTTTHEKLVVSRKLGAGHSSTSRTFDATRVVVIAGTSDQPRTETHIVGTVVRKPGGEIPPPRKSDTEDK